MPISEGIQAPDFSLADESENVVKLSGYRGKFVLLYFYPKDDTPGCTTEACNFRNDYTTYQKAGVTILGVSPDTSQKHTKFIEKYQLPFTLLADTDHHVCELYGVWGKKKFMGRENDGVFRTTFLIDPQGIIRKVYNNVKPDTHSAEVLQELARLSL